MPATRHEPEVHRTLARIFGSTTLVLSDEHLEFWGARFAAAAHLHERQTFEQFMVLPVAQRLELLDRDSQVEAAQVAAERGLGAHCHLAGPGLVEPVCPPTRRFRRPWFFGRRR
jgi:hypothetical protein